MIHIKEPVKIGKVALQLKKCYKHIPHHNKNNPLDELLFIICSIKRSEAVYRVAFQTLKKEFPRHKDLVNVSHAKLSSILKPFGLQNQKASVIKEALKKSIKRFGKPTLSPLKQMNVAECENFLLSIRGVGKKVARCVIMFSLNKKVFPVDSNCWRVSHRLGWIKWPHSGKSVTNRDMDLLQEIIPRNLRHSLHVNMVSHGRTICTARNPKCSQCVIKAQCKSYFYRACQ